MIVLWNLVWGSIHFQFVHAGGCFTGGRSSVEVTHVPIKAEGMVFSRGAKRRL